MNLELQPEYRTHKQVMANGLREQAASCRRLAGCARARERATRGLRSLRPVPFLLLAFLIAGCAQPMRPNAFTTVSIQDLITDPASWLGRAVEVEGIVRTEADNSSRLQENCSSTAQAILVRWHDVPGFRTSDDGAKVRLRGVFRQADGPVRKPALQNVSIVQRWPPGLPRCAY